MVSHDTLAVMIVGVVGALAVILLANISDRPNLAGDAFIPPGEVFPAAYAPPVDPAGNRYLNVTIAPINGNARLEISVEGERQYIFQTGYYLNSTGQWRAFSFPQEKIGGSKWIYESATRTISNSTRPDMPSEGYILAYVCKKETAGFICGPKTTDQQPSERYWTLHWYKLDSPSSGGCIQDSECGTGEVCIAGTCEEACPQAGQSRCDPNGEVETCNADGYWGVPQSCPAEQTCMDGSCQVCETCTQGSTTCTSTGKIRDCVNGCWSTPDVCAPGEICTGGSCQPDTGGCTNPCSTEGATMCASGTSEQICVNGCWSSPQTCGQNRVCTNNQCTDSSCDSCIAGSMRCDPNTPYKAQECNLWINGCLTWSTYANCGFSGQACEEGVCVDTCTDECTQGQSQCTPDGTGVQSCAQDGNCWSWSTPKPCEDSCSNGQCTTSQNLKISGFNHESGDINTGFCKETSAAVAGTFEISITGGDFEYSQALFADVIEVCDGGFGTTDPISISAIIDTNNPQPQYVLTANAIFPEGYNDDTSDDQRTLTIVMESNLRYDVDAAKGTTATGTKWDSARTLTNWDQPSQDIICSGTQCIYNDECYNLGQKPHNRWVCGKDIDDNAALFYCGWQNKNQKVPETNKYCCLTQDYAFQQGPCA